ncbi:hypothetical protein [Dickeya fangzhongdai]|uniref:hypothetical protein n=1 Tax=Dickeya fangzhongdai TaxID=1778540 RepID=UPI0023E4546B|nr:hypothetical protein [Dickeya fangzhongdai]WES91296.1 hypothetical protein PQ617_09815 [Dickeya fangzhongdai]
MIPSPAPLIQRTRPQGGFLLFSVSIVLSREDTLLIRYHLINTFHAVNGTNPARSFQSSGKEPETLAHCIDTVIRYTKKADWVGDRFKEREIRKALREETASYDVDIDEVIDLARQQKEYH